MLTARISGICPKVKVKNAIVVNKSTGCWEWQKARNPKGYGRMSLVINGKKTMQLAHRVSYTFFVGEIPDGLLVMHSCDNPCCCNPEHLKVGTAKDNTKDMMDKGRNKYKVRTGKSHHAYSHGLYVGGKVPPKNIRNIISEARNGVT